MRIISLAPSNTEILFALGIGDLIVGKTIACDYPAEAKSIRSIASWVNVRDMKFLDELKPDIVITSGYLPECLQEACTERSIHIEHVNPQSLDGIYNSILQIGNSIDRKIEALNVINSIKQELKIIKKNRPKKKLHVYCEEWDRPPTASANWVPELIEIAGGKSFARSGIYSHEFDIEELLKFKPDIIILCWCRFAEHSHSQTLPARPGWDKLQAVIHNHIICIDNSLLNRPGPRILQGAKAIQEVLKNII